MLKVPKYKDITLLFSVFNTILTLGTLKPTFTIPAPPLAKFVTISSIPAHTFITPAPTFITPVPTFTPPEPPLAKFVTISSRIMMTSSRIMMTFSKIMMTSSKNVTTSTFLREYIR